MALFGKKQKKMEADAENEKVHSRAKAVWEYVQVFIIAAVLALFCSRVLIVNANIPSGSMENTIYPGDRLIGFRLAYLMKEPERKDIILFRFPDDESQIFIKRVIGLPGETVRVEDGKVYINDSDEPLEEPYLKETMEGSFGPYEVPENSYFVMGDNRNNSRDSRYWEDPFVEKDQILAEAMFQYFPKVGKVE